jgi:hypothetical protein
MKNQNIELTAKEKELINNLDGNVTRGKHFGQLQAKKYVGKNQNFLFLNMLKQEEGGKYVGALRMARGEDLLWYFDAIDGETYRIPEPEGGIDELFDIEFKRRDV